MITATFREDGTIMCTSAGTSQILKATRIEIPFDIPADQLHNYKVIDRKLHQLVNGNYEEVT